MLSALSTGDPCTTAVYHLGVLLQIFSSPASEHCMTATCTFAGICHMNGSTPTGFTTSVHQGVSCFHGRVGVWQIEPPSQAGAHAGVGQPGHAQQRIPNNQGQLPQCCVTVTAQRTKAASCRVADTSLGQLRGQLSKLLPHGLLVCMQNLTCPADPAALLAQCLLPTRVQYVVSNVLYSSPEP